MPIRKLFNWIQSKRGAQGATAKQGEGGEPLIIVITPEDEVRDEMRLVKKLFAAGLPRLHLRRHEWTVNELRDWLCEVPKKYRERIVVHGHPELVAEFGLAGVHVQAGKGRPARLPEGVALSRSCHDYGELCHGPKDCVYATLGPVFPSVSKRGYAPRRTPEEYAAIVSYWKTENKGHPVVALGGITPENAGEARKLGFDGIAVVGTVWESPNPVEAFKALRDAWLR